MTMEYEHDDHPSGEHAGHSVRDSGRILLEAAPAGADIDAVGARLAAVPNVVEVHDLHLWQITSGGPALSAHVIVADHAGWNSVRTDLRGLLRDSYGIRHATPQVDHTLAPTAPVDDLKHCDEADGPLHRSAMPGAR